MGAYYTIVAIFFLAGAVLLLIALLGRNPKHLGSAVGTLTNSRKVMRRRGKADERKYPATACTYTYQVDGKTYRLKQEGFFARSGLMRKITVVYLKGFPRFGYPEKFPCWHFVVFGIFALLCGICYLLMPYL